MHHTWEVIEPYLCNTRFIMALLESILCLFGKLSDCKHQIGFPLWLDKFPKHARRVKSPLWTIPDSKPDNQKPYNTDISTERPIFKSPKSFQVYLEALKRPRKLSCFCKGGIFLAWAWKPALIISLECIIQSTAANSRDRQLSSINYF